MSLSIFNGDTDVISALGDTPPVDDDLTPAQFKSKFDLAAGRIKTYINTVLVPYINNTLLAKITGTAGVLKTTSGGAVSAGQIARADIADSAVSTAQIQNRSITAEKIGSYQITANELAADCVETSRVKNGAVTDAKVGGNVRVIKMGTATPTTSTISDGQIYLKYS